MNTGIDTPVPPASRTWPWRWLRAPLWSPQGFVVRAALIAMVYVVMNLLGWSESTSLVCGTSPTGDVTDGLVLFKGCAFVVAHFAMVLGVPTLLLGAGVFALLLERTIRTQPSPVSIRRYSPNTPSSATVT